MTRKRLTLGQAALLVLGLSTTAWMGVPSYGRYRAPEGALAGVVLDADGTRIGGAEVALFDDARLILVERVRTDDHGRFAFTDAPDRFDVYACAGDDAAEAESTGTWVLARDRSRGTTLELRLGHGTPRTISVRDEGGLAVSGAEVRVLDARGEPQVIQRAMTDAEGHAVVSLPSHSHVVVLPPGGGDLAQRWILDLEDPTELAEEITLLPAHRVEGLVADERGAPLAGELVSAWTRDGARYLGWTLTDVTGAFALATDGTTALLRVADPQHRFVARGLPLPGDLEGPLGTVVLTEGARVSLQVGTGAQPIPARVWVRGEEENSWSFGGRTDALGRIDLATSAHFSAMAVPIEASSEVLGRTLEAHDRVPNGVPLQLLPDSTE